SKETRHREPIHPCLMSSRLDQPRRKRRAKGGARGAEILHFLLLFFSGPNRILREQRTTRVEALPSRAASAHCRKTLRSAPRRVASRLDATVRGRRRAQRG